ncbi:hypothetical protein SAMN05660916_01085 [Arthrobacter sp. 31Cvi3.1E]|nr:hypothetical protein SAMN05660916_01085 [Arthrobacter sp. 31Cvi3.1E]
MAAPEPAETGGTGCPGASDALGSEPSAYLRQHAGNPVHCRPFGDDGLAFAAAGLRPPSPVLARGIAANCAARC